jgi:hypothetical protein
MVNGIHVIICLYPRLLSENLNKVKCKREILIHTGSLVFKFVLCADDQQLFNNKPFIHSFSQDIKDSTHIACYWLYFQPIFPAWIHQRRQIHNTSILKNTTTKIVDIIDLPVSIKWIGSTICMSMHPIVRSVYLPNWQRSIPGNSREQLVSPRYRPHINLRNIMWHISMAWTATIGMSNTTSWNFQQIWHCLCSYKIGMYFGKGSAKSHNDHDP